MINDMVNIALQYAADDSHGYSQVRRWPWQGDDRDCSSLMYCCANQAGYDVPLSGYTGSMVNDFSDAGFNVIPYSQVGYLGLKPGDILLNTTHHTEMYIGDGLMVGAHIAETGDIDGTEGDQTSNEISVTPFYVPWFGWDYVLRPFDSSESEDMMTCFAYQPDEQSFMVYYDGKNHIASCPEEIEAAQEAYRLATGRELPIFALGNKKNKMGHHFMELVAR